MMRFSDVVKRHCEARGWTQAELSKRAGLSRTYVSKMFTDRFNEPSLSKAKAIADAFGVTLQSLVDEMEDDGQTA